MGIKAVHLAEIAWRLLDLQVKLIFTIWNWRSFANDPLWKTF